MGWGVGVGEINVVEAEAIVTEAVVLSWTEGIPITVLQYAVNTYFT